MCYFFFFFFSSRRRHTRFDCDWSSDVCSSDLLLTQLVRANPEQSTISLSFVTGKPVLRLYERFGFKVDRKSTRLNSSHSQISYAVFCLKKKNSIEHSSKEASSYNVALNSISISHD